MPDTLEQRVVAIVDGSAACWATVSLAAAEARLRHHPLRLTSAAGGLSGGFRPYLGALVRRLRDSWPDLAVTARVVDGDVTEVLAGESRRAALVFADRDRVSGRHRQVAARAFCPVVVVPPSTSQVADGPVLLGLDISPHDEPAVWFAFEEAALRGVPLVAVHVWSGVPGTALGDINPFAYDLGQARGAADRLLAEALAGWVEKYPTVPVRRMALYDADPARTLLQANAGAGLVVVGANKYGRTTPQLLGPVARALLDNADCPVGIVREADV